MYDCCHLPNTAVSCSPLPVPGNTSISYSDTTNDSGNYSFGTEASYSCEAGYFQVSGDEIRTCEMNGRSTTGVWGGIEAMCEGKVIFNSYRYLH